MNTLAIQLAGYGLRFVRHEPNAKLQFQSCLRCGTTIDQSVGVCVDRELFNCWASCKQTYTCLHITNVLSCIYHQAFHEANPPTFTRQISD